jgi:ribosomal protein S18 acetylase RimI-like enzyme
MDVALVTRRGCHLCSDALAEVRALGLEPRLLDVDGDSALFDQFDFRVPVLLVEGRAVGEGRLDHATLARALGLPAVRVLPCGPEAAGAVHDLTQRAFAPHARLDPPSGAGLESLESVAEELAVHGGALASTDGRPAGCLRLRDLDGHLHVRRVAVAPDRQGLGIGRALMRWAEAEAARRGADGVSVGVRLALPGNLEFYRRLGYREVERHRHPGYDRPTWVLLHKRVPLA